MGQNQPSGSARSLASWTMLVLASIVTGILWGTYALKSAGTHAAMPPALAIGVGNLVVACFTASLMGLFAERKGRNPFTWALGFAVPAMIAGIIPLIAGAILISFVPKEKPDGSESTT